MHWYYYGVPFGSGLGAVAGLSVALDCQGTVSYGWKYLLIGSITAGTVIGGALWPLTLTGLLLG